MIKHITAKSRMFVEQNAEGVKKLEKSLPPTEKLKHIKASLKTSKRAATTV